MHEIFDANTEAVLLADAENAFEMLCGIWYRLYNLNNVKNSHGRVLLLVKLQAIASNTSHISSIEKIFFLQY